MLVDYTHYLKHYCVFPVIVSCFSLAVFIFLVFDVKKYIQAKDISLKNVFRTVFSTIVMLVFLINAGILPLCKGNLYLLMEKEENAVILSGSIESIEMLDDTLYGMTQMYEFIINDMKCKAIYVPTENSQAKTPFKEGDYVDVLYLPKSGYILSIEEARCP